MIQAHSTMIQRWQDVLWSAQHDTPFPPLIRVWASQDARKPSVVKEKPQKQNESKEKPSKYEHKTGVRHVRYYLGAEYPGIFLTQRELDCLRYYAQENTILEAARLMGRSYRAAEILLVSVRKKVGCKKAKDLLKHSGVMQVVQNPSPASSPRSYKKK